jgi:hypothetical protein
MIVTFIDLDGTIEDSRQDMAAAAAAVRQRLELRPRPEAELRALVNRGMDRLYRDCFPELFERAAMLNLDERMALREAADYYAREYAARIVETTRPYAGVVAALTGPSGLARALHAHYGRRLLRRDQTQRPAHAHRRRRSWICARPGFCNHDRRYPRRRGGGARLWRKVHLVPLGLSERGAGALRRRGGDPGRFAGAAAATLRALTML